MKISPLIKQAQMQLQMVKGQILSLEERTRRAIDLTALILEESRRIQTEKERRQQEQLARMMQDPIGKIFTAAITDQCFRSHQHGRAANQLAYLIDKYGVPKSLSLDKRLSLRLFSLVGPLLAPILVPATIRMLRQETAHVILPGEKKPLLGHLKRRHQEGVRVNLNHLGEAILSEEEAERRLQLYLDDLTQPYIECISIKISTIFSQINLLAWEETLNVLSERLRQLYRAAKAHPYRRADGELAPKFVNLDMEEYRDLHLTVALFCKVLSEPEFKHYPAGIALQAYLPDTVEIQQKLTEWAQRRVADGGAPIKIRLVKGANLAMEQVEASLKGWPQAPYLTKSEVDANYKRMMMYGCQPEHARAVHLGIGSHNLFDIAYALLLRAENQMEKEIGFEMLEGMADPMRRVVQQLSGDMLLYCPVATKEEFQNAVAYLVRRLDENTAPENFLRQVFDLTPRTPAWQEQASRFAQSVADAPRVSNCPRRQQNRLQQEQRPYRASAFHNEPDTDWALPQNRKWIQDILHEWSEKFISTIPLVIGGEYIDSNKKFALAQDPSKPAQILYQYIQATVEQAEQAVKFAKRAEAWWANTSVQERIDILGRIAQNLRIQRGILIGAMVADTGKTVQEADVEVSEAIDFAEYYRSMMGEWDALKDIRWQPKGTVLVAPPWNFPCSIPAGGLLAALVTGNCVIFKPASEAALVGWELVKLFWQAGVDQDVLQFIMCEDDPVGSRLVQDPRLNAVILTGATATAKLLLNLRPDLDLIAETGGKNTMVITAMADRDLAIRDLLQSAFGHAGQKCSACSLAILEAEVYDDPHFLQQLKEAAASLSVGYAWNLKTKINPLIRIPNETLRRGLTQLEAGETWLLEPKQDRNNPLLWSPGIKLGVKPESFTFQNELFGPVLGVVRASDFEDALEIMNQTPYGLTAGIHSLDDREQSAWLEKIEAGNCYINRTITGAIVQRQPFGGCKESSFGRGSKAGGPNYLTQLMVANPLTLPQENDELTSPLMSLTSLMEKDFLSPQDKEIWQASLGNYAFYWRHYFSQAHDPSLVLGQDNFLRYVPHSHMLFRIQEGDADLDILRVIAAAKTCDAALEVSYAESKFQTLFKNLEKEPKFTHIQETEEHLIIRLSQSHIKRVRLLQTPSQALQKSLAKAACSINSGPVLANGRLELLNYLREVSISRDYHRYGNLGDREGETRMSLKECAEGKKCGACGCHESFSCLE